MRLEQRLKTFVDVTVHYFGKVTSEEAQIEAPQIDFGDRELSDYTGIIQVSGPARGLVYMTAPANMLGSLLRAMGEEDQRPNLMADLVGEMTNNISSNARRDFGSSFEVSVPKVIRRGEDFPFEAPQVAFVLPIQWREFLCHLVIAIEEEVEAGI